MDRQLFPRAIFSVLPVVALLAFGLGIPRPVVAQQLLAVTETRETLEADLYLTRLAEVEAELARLRSQVEAGPAPVDESVCDGCDAAQRWCGVQAGADISFLELHSASSTGPGGIGSPAPVNTNFEPAYRLWLGYSTAGGVGVRARYWEYDQVSSNLAMQSFISVDTYTLDLELTATLPIARPWNVLVSGGVRYVHYDERRGYLPNYTAEDLTTSQYGLILGGEARRDLFGYFDVYGISRAAAVFGDGRENSQNLDIYNRLGGMFENQLGIEYTRNTSLGLVTFRTGAEAQYWCSFTDEFGYEAGQAVGFVGFLTGLSIVR